MALKIEAADDDELRGSEIDIRKIVAETNHHQFRFRKKLQIASLKFVTVEHLS